jgi:uncharacterized Zn finger protein (UPF0148 family)
MTKTQSCPSCGKKTSTRFCGDCGTQVQTDHLADLHAYLLKKARGARTSAETAGKQAAAGGDDKTGPEYYQRRADERLKEAEKWEAWLEALANLEEAAKKSAE